MGVLKLIEINDRFIECIEENEILRVEAWGRGLRVRSTMLSSFTENDWALDVSVDEYRCETGDDFIECEGVRCEICDGRLVFSTNGRTILEEKFYPWALHKTARYYKAIPMADSFKVCLSFEPQDEILHGMGQYRDSVYDLKGTGSAKFADFGSVCCVFCRLWIFME